MKKISVIACLCAATLLTSSCYGSFALFNKIVKWEGTATNSRIANEIIYLILTPVNVICAAADFIVVNAIEFWSGENPMAQNVGKTQNVMGEDGMMYAVKTLKNGYEVTNEKGEKVKYIHDAKTDSWSFVQNGKKTELLRYNGDGTINAFINGHSMRVTQDQAGLMQVRMAVDGSAWAMR